MNRRMGANKKTAAVVVFVVLEIILLLVAPLAYFTFLTPKPEPKLALFKSYPLTDNQIRAAWPNLPTAQEIIKSGMYSSVDTNEYIVGSNSTTNMIFLLNKPRWWDNSSYISCIIQNETVTNIPNTLRGGIIPVVYRIYVPLNTTVWVEVPQTYLRDSSHPPASSSDGTDGFLGTDMPTTYGLAAVSIILVTIALGSCYLAFLYYRVKPETLVGIEFGVLWRLF